MSGQPGSYDPPPPCFSSIEPPCLSAAAFAKPHTRRCLRMAWPTGWRDETEVFHVTMAASPLRLASMTLRFPVTADDLWDFICLLAVQASI